MKQHQKECAEKRKNDQNVKKNNVCKSNWACAYNVPISISVFSNVNQNNP